MMDFQKNHAQDVAVQPKSPGGVGLHALYVIHLKRLARWRASLEKEK